MENVRFVFINSREFLRNVLELIMLMELHTLIKRKTVKTSIVITFHIFGNIYFFVMNDEDNHN